MRVAVSTRKWRFTFVATIIFMLLLLTSCGGIGNTTSPPSPTNNANAASVATATSLMKLVSFIGQPKVKMLSGTTFEADGQLKNNDSNQHDFTLKVTLLDASGKVIATATQLVDNVKGGDTVSYVIQGTTTQPSWSNVEVAVIKVSENINGSGTD